MRAYLIAKLDEELPPARMRGLETAYRLFGLLPDTLDAPARCCSISTPSRWRATTIPTPPCCSAWRGPTASQLRLVLAHEMVHALQGQYLPLDSILKATASNDRLTAAQSILEGQATLASIEVLAPGQGVTAHAAVLGAVPRPGARSSSRRCRSSRGRRWWCGRR